MSKTALITGITGQDGAYLAQLLLDQGYEVHGMVRRSSSDRFDRIEPLIDDITLHQADLLDQLSIVRLIEATSPDEVYNLAAQSHVRVSFDCPVETTDIVATGTLKLLEAIR